MYTFLFIVFFFSLQHESIPLKKSPDELKKKSPGDADEQSIQKTTD